MRRHRHLAVAGGVVSAAVVVGAVALLPGTFRSDDGDRAVDAPDDQTPTTATVFCSGPGDTTGVDPDIGEYPDAESYANELDIDPAEATRRLSLQERWSDTRQDLRLSGLTSFASTGVRHEPDFALTLYLVGASEVEEACDIIRPAGLAPLVEIHTDAALRPADLDRLLDALEIPDELVDSVQGIGYDTSADKITVDLFVSSVDLEEDIRPRATALFEQALTEAAERTGLDATSIGITIDISNARLGP